MVAARLAIICLFPYLTRFVPSPLACIVILIFVAVWLGLDVRRVGDMGEFPSALPVFLVPQVPWKLETLLIVLPDTATMAALVAQVLHAASTSSEEGRARHYIVTSQVFFASAESFFKSFDFKEAIERVRIDVSRAHFCDSS